MTKEISISKVLEETLKNRIKFIGDNEQIYTGCPQDLIDELSQAMFSILDSIPNEEKEIKCSNCGKSDYTEGIDFDDMSFCRSCCEKAGMTGEPAPDNKLPKWEEMFNEFTTAKPWELNATRFYVDATPEELKQFIQSLLNKSIQEERRIQFAKEFEKRGKLVEAVLQEERERIIEKIKEYNDDPFMGNFETYIERLINFINK
jgi:hypothetical protein